MNSPDTPAVSVHDQATLPPGSRGSESPRGADPLASGMPAGRQLGDYELQAELGRGGMGVVFRARQKSLNRLVAVKLILAGRLASAEDIARFHAEAEAAAVLDHPGILPIYEVGVCEGQHYFSMAYVEGENLATRIERGPLAPADAAECLRQLADAVEYAHVRGIIHRDLKPGNILVDQQGRFRITDFGLARRWQAGEDQSSLKDVCGTVSYMPPEQAEGQSRLIGPASDIYALGATLYCLLTGRPPFQSANPIDTLLQVVQQLPVPPRQLNPAIPVDLETICLKCLEKDPTRRYASALALGEDVQRFLQDQPILARPPGRWEQLRRWSRQHPGLALSGSLTVAAMLTLLMVSVLYNFLLQGEQLQARAATLDAQRLQQSTQQLLEQLAQLRQSERAVNVLQFSEYGRLSWLAHQLPNAQTAEEATAIRRELQALLANHQDVTNPALQHALLQVEISLADASQFDATQWSRLAEELTRQCRADWLSQTATLPALRDQVRQVTTARFLSTALGLLNSDQEASPAETLAELRKLADGELAIVGADDVREAVATFLAEFHPDRKPLSHAQLKAAIETLKAQCAAPVVVLPTATLSDRGDRGYHV